MDINESLMRSLKQTMENGEYTNRKTNGQNCRNLKIIPDKCKNKFVISRFWDIQSFIMGM